MAERNEVTDKGKRPAPLWFEYPIDPEAEKEVEAAEHKDGLWEKHHPQSLRGSREPLSVR